MVKLLVIADDFTGALDTGVQFKAKGTVVQVWDEGGTDLFSPADGTVQVLVLDAETRHMPPERAYAVVKDIVEHAVAAGIPYIYKKTDSALRGNIGSELTAMLEASGQPRLHFVPSFPKMGRKTIGGVHFIDGVPVAESVFGADPFEPVRRSSVQEIIAGQSGVATHLMPPAAQDLMRDGVLIHSAASDEELAQIAARLKEKDQLHLLAGCAGLASVLPALLGLTASDQRLPVFERRLLTVCGSTNPITCQQLDASERGGARRIRLTPRQKLEPTWLESEEGAHCLQQWQHQVWKHSSTIIDCNSAEGLETANRCAAVQGVPLEHARRLIADTMGSVLKGLLDLGVDCTLLVTGGDTLVSCMRKIGQNRLCPICELVPGVVLSQIRYRGKMYNLLSKSGGFGTEMLMVCLERMISQSGAANSMPDHNIKGIDPDFQLKEAFVC